ncbi:hypothetical protein L195_g023097, partial [Trifolium pratense]
MTQIPLKIRVAVPKNEEHRLSEFKDLQRLLSEQPSTLLVDRIFSHVLFTPILSSKGVLCACLMALKLGDLSISLMMLTSMANIASCCTGREALVNTGIFGILVCVVKDRSTPAINQAVLTVMSKLCVAGSVGNTGIAKHLQSDIKALIYDLKDILSKSQAMQFGCQALSYLTKNCSVKTVKILKVDVLGYLMKMLVDENVKHNMVVCGLIRQIFVNIFNVSVGTNIILDRRLSPHVLSFLDNSDRTLQMETLLAFMTMSNSQ